MKQILAWMAKGLLAILPITITLYALYWLVTTAEGLLAPLIRWVFGEGFYVPGSGLVLVAGLLVGTGILIDAYVGRWLLRVVETIVDRLPLVKTIYGAVEDLLRFVIPSQSKEQARKVVAWEARENAWMVGFVTGAPFVHLDVMGAAPDPVQGRAQVRAEGRAPGREQPGGAGTQPGNGDAEGNGWVSVYFPMSYQVGGYTLMLREADLQVLDMTVEEAMRSVLTAGVARR